MKFRWGSVAGILPILIGLSLLLNAPNSQADRIHCPDGSDINTDNVPTPCYDGVKLSGYQIKKAVVKSGQTLSMILKPYGLTASAVFKATESAKGVFDVRRMKVGQPYSIVRDPEQFLEIKYFIYEKTPVDFVVFEFGKSPGVFSGRKTLETRTHQISGTITRSLWDAIKAQGVHTDLILKLEAVLGYKVDYRRLKPGTRFDIFYEESYDGDQFLRIESIIAARLTSGGNQVAAFRYSHHGTVGYFDRYGNNVQTDFLRSPLHQYDKVTSGYSTRRKHPITKKYRKHPAIDFGAPAGTPVMSVGDGIVDKISYTATAGNYITINHLYSFKSQYLHLSAVDDGLQIGSKVKKGDVIGYVGSTGLATGPHLDFRFSENGQLVDYFNIELPDGQPVDAACKDDFDLIIKQMIANLEGSESHANEAG
jgi:murein DD-endopeptidase MepM/ murein hydrolase activator NlpD